MSDDATISCPKCHAPFPLTDAIAQPMIEKLRGEFEAEASKKEAALRLREQQLSQKANELEQSKESLEQQIAARLNTERQKLIAEQESKAREAVTVQLQDLHQQLEEKARKLRDAQESQLALLKQKRELDEQKRELDLQMARQADEIQDKVRKEKDEEFRLKEAQQNKQLEDMKRQIDELKRKAEQGSQQAQGEVLELDLESALQRCFAGDEITPVPKGTHGGDMLQQVKDEVGHRCGSIIWETKRTKAWSNGWLAKLKDDRIAAKAQLAVIVSLTMPRDAGGFECRQNVWVTPPNLALPLAAALRMTLIETSAAKRAVEGRHDKMAIVYDYLSGNEFKNRVTAIVEAFVAMRKDLEDEKKAVTRLWAKREKQLERVMSNTAGLHGDLAGIIGQSLPAIATLELPTDGEPANGSPPRFIEH